MYSVLTLVVGSIPLVLELDDGQRQRNDGDDAYDPPDLGAAAANEDGGQAGRGDKAGSVHQSVSPGRVLVGIRRRRPVGSALPGAPPAQCPTTEAVPPFEQAVVSCCRPADGDYSHHTEYPPQRPGHPRRARTAAELQRARQPGRGVTAQAVCGFLNRLADRASAVEVVPLLMHNRGCGLPGVPHHCRKVGGRSQCGGRHWKRERGSAGTQIGASRTFSP